MVLEPPASKAMTVQVRLSGTPAAGFAASAPHWTPLQATISGSESEVARAVAVVADLNVDGLRADVDREVALVAKDAAGETIDTLTLEPAVAEVTLPVEQQGGYRDVVVKAVIRGQVKSGYRLTGISVFPPLVTLFSTDPAAVANLPGYVETEPLDISGAQADVSGSLKLTLPANVTAVGEPVIFVQVGVAAIEDSVTVTRDVRQQGLAPGLSARLSPTSVDVIVSGPVPLLKALRASDVEVYLDLTGLAPGTYQLQVSYRVLSAAVSIAPRRSPTITGAPADHGSIPADRKPIRPDADLTSAMTLQRLSASDVPSWMRCPAPRATAWWRRASGAGEFSM
jgi:YbbR domain-containing protein